MGKPLDDELTDDALTGRFRIYQRRRGHRYSLDDTLTAWEAASARPRARAHVDLGCGIGSVLLMLADKLSPARSIGIEAQEESMALARRNVQRNGLGADVELVLGDLRDDALLDALRAKQPEGFDLVTGTPPYKSPHEGPISPDPQRAHARVELRGGVEAYLGAAARLLCPQGLCVVCAGGDATGRVEEAALAAGLVPLTRRDVLPAGPRKGVLFRVWSLALAASARTEAYRRLEPFVARDEGGRRSLQARQLREFFGLAAPQGEPPSPRRRARSQGR